jgi:hypothetical protein
MRYLFIVILFSFGCKNKPNVVYEVKNLTCEESGCFDVQKWRNEILFLDSIRINNEIPLLCTISEYRGFFGKELNSYEIDYEDIALSRNVNKVPKRFIFKGAIVDQLGSSAILNTIDLTINPIKLFTPNLVLQKGTKISEVASLYPNSCRLILMNGFIWSGYVELKTHSSGYDFRRVVLIFKKEKLVKIKIIKHNVLEN